MRRISFLGPVGTYTEEAARCLKTDAELIPVATIAQVLQAVEKGEVDGGLVPMENSLEGSVSQTLDLLVQMNLKIQQEVIMPITHNLLAKKGCKPEDIKIVYSHPQAIAQCRDYLEAHLPQALVELTPSTANAASQVMGSTEAVAAIAGVGAANLYNLETLAEGIQDGDNNETRFILVAKEDVGEFKGDARTSLFVSISDRPGGLYQILREFALRGITLSKIESRPAKKQLGDYIFFIELLGHQQDLGVKQALDALKVMTIDYKILGSYPVGVCRQEAAENQETAVSLDILRKEIDIIDFQVVELLAQRTSLVKKVGEVKGYIGKEIKDNAREELILNRIKQLAGDKGFSPEVIEDVYKTLFSYFVSLQK